MLSKQIYISLIRMTYKVTVVLTKSEKDGSKNK